MKTDIDLKKFEQASIIINSFKETNLEEKPIQELFQQIQLLKKEAESQKQLALNQQKLL